MKTSSVYSSLNSRLLFKPISSHSSYPSSNSFVLLHMKISFVAHSDSILVACFTDEHALPTQLLLQSIWKENVN